MSRHDHPACPATAGEVEPLTGCSDPMGTATDGTQPLARGDTDFLAFGFLTS